MGFHVLSYRGLSVAALLTFAVVPAYGQWTNGQAASFVVGKGSFTDASDNTLNASRISGSHSVAVDEANGKMYVGDTFRNRVLRFAYPITSNGPAAELVFGQPDFSSSTADNGGISASSLDLPHGVAVDGTGRLFIADHYNNRILVFHNAHQITTNKPAADIVLGQSSFTGSAAATSQNGLRAPVQLTVDHLGNLWVPDRGNHRVLLFSNAGSLTNGANASLVLGQSGYTTAAAGGGATGLNNPEGVARIDNSLFISDGSNHRVLRFDSIDTKTNGAAADAVLGQTNLTNATSGLAADRFNYPRGLDTDRTGRLYVPDEGNHRILIFNSAASKPSGASADFVLGQPDFVTATAATTQTGMNGPIALSVDSTNDHLSVIDYHNNRLLVFSASTDLPVSVSALEIE